jgi:hypothetical protein
MGRDWIQLVHSPTSGGESMSTLCRPASATAASASAELSSVSELRLLSGDPSALLPPGCSGTS